jgi:hypothetical protein
MKICNCPVCGLAWSEGVDEEELRCSFWICDCCGCEYGYDDNPKYREAWVKQGTPWFNKCMRPQDWSLEAQMKYIIIDWNA